MIIIRKSFPCRSEHVRTYLYFGVWMHVVAENYEQKHTHTWDNRSNDNTCKYYSKRVSSYIHVQYVQNRFQHIKHMR